MLNPDSRADAEIAAFPEGVIVHRPEYNLGWAGGLHLARVAMAAEYFVWAQDDMVVSDGWLDSLVATADAHPDAGAVGSVEVDPETGEPNGFAGGYAEPADDVRSWNNTDVVRRGEYVEGDSVDWVTSKGMLTRSAAWDSVHGPDPRLYPLNHVDKDYSTHLRAHGWRLLIAPAAHLIHRKHRSAPLTFRLFLEQWQEPDFNRHWGGVVASLDRGEAKQVPHECSPWGSLDASEVVRLVGREASRMLVPASRHAAEQLATFEETARAHARRIEDLEHQIRRLDENYRQSTSWRITAPLRFVASRGLRRGGRDRAPR